jgi:PIN domain nuclease of toxin-antitoxin system
MRLLLDTHIFLWAFLEPEKLTDFVIEELLENDEHEKIFSAASSWEIAIKWSKSRLELPEHPSIYVPKRMLEVGIKPLPITHWDTLNVSNLPPIHQDPFDRLLVTQANRNGLTLLTDDEIITQYEVDFIEAKSFKV